MGHLLECGPEERLFDALGEVIELDQEDALDVGALSGNQLAVCAALARINEMQVELAQLTDHFTEYKDKVGLHLVH